MAIIMKIYWKKILSTSLILLMILPFAGCSSGGGGGGGGDGTSTPSVDVSADDLTSYQWHLKNTGQSAFASESGTAGEDTNQQSTYDASIDGDGIIVAVVDSGLEIAHVDLDANVVSGESWNFVYSTSDPTNSFDSDGDHGTSVAGLIAAEDNGNGGRGIAPKASLKGFNFLKSQSVTNHIKALGGTSSSPKSNDVDIFNMSYGFSNTDDFVLDTSLAAHLQYAVTNLRSNKGAIFVKSSGNGFGSYGSSPSADCTLANSEGLSCQNVNMDPIAATPWVINVGALNAGGKRSSYSTGGSGVWISAPGGEYGYDQSYGWAAPPTNPIEIFQPAMITTDQSGCSKGYSTSSSDKNRFEDNSNGMNDGCGFTSTFNGTSSAAPVVSGAIALILETNPNLTWRDVKHILATTAKKVDPTHSGFSFFINGVSYQANQGWVTNNASTDYHNWYGFGAVDVDAAVTEAGGGYTLLSAMTSDSTTDVPGQSITDFTASGITRNITFPSTFTVEVVEVTVSITHADIGQLAVELESPNATKSILLTMYNGFKGSADLSNMVLISNAFYGETSGGGSWTLRVIDGVSGTAGTLDSWTLKIYGR